MPTHPRAARHIWRRVLSALVAGILGAAALVAVASSPAAASTSTSYYVDCSAASNGSGSQSSPWNSTASVNAATFQPGDKILFARGTTCSGALAPKGSGDSSADITVDAYGTGAQPVLAAASTADAAFLLSDQSYWTVQNLKITGGVHYGVYVTGDTANATLTDITLNNLDVSGATGTTSVRGDSGEVYIYPRGSKEVIDNVVVNGVTAHDSNVGEGIFASGAYGAFPPGTSVPGPGGTPIGDNITVENSTAYSVAGDGILMAMASNGTIENSVAHDSGACSSCGSTPSGLWEWYCQKCTLQFNESYDNHTWGQADGGAFDIDNYNTSNTLQYNYGHDNDGYCLAVFGDQGFTPVDDVFRYNVCSDNEQKSDASSYELSIWPEASTNLQIYNNTFYFNPAHANPFMQQTSSSAGGVFKNNIVYSTKTDLLQTSSDSLAFDNNDYYISTGGTPTFTHDGTTYSGLAAYQSGTGQDTHSLTADPKLNGPTYDAVGVSPVAFTLQPGSPAYGAGVDICQGVPNCSMGDRDYFGHPVTTAGTHSIGADDEAVPLSNASNTGFESGSCASWQCYGGASAVASDARTGNYSVRLPAGGGAEQTVSGLSPDTTYTLRGFAKSGAAGSCVYVGVKDYGGSEARGCVTTTSYGGTGATFTTGPSDTTAVIYFWYPSGSSGTAYGDDIAVSAVPALHSYGALQNSASGSCADVTGNSRTAGAAAELWTCNGAANQQWTRASNGELQVFGAGTLCLDVSGSATSPGSAVVTASCTDSSTQQWVLNSSGTITDKASGLCLGPAGGATSDGTALQIQTCSGSSSQTWKAL